MIHEVEASLQTVLKAFENLDWSTFINAFAEDASGFFPFPEPPERAGNRVEIARTFTKVFEYIRQKSPDGPPFHRLAPEDLNIAAIGPDVYLASFHLRNEERIARRTLVFARRAGQWKIVHLHASNAPVPSGCRPIDTLSAT